MKFELKPNNRNPDSQEVIEDLKKIATKLEKQTLTVNEYNLYGRWHPCTPIRLFKSWNNALKSAGLEAIKRMNIRIEELYENLYVIWTTLGRQPFISDIKKPFSKFDSSVYKKRFGSWRKAIESFVAHANDKNIENTQMLNKNISLKTNTSRSVGWRTRFLVMKRDSFKCQICGNSPATEAKTKLVIDHIIPYSKGGETSFDNLQTLCEICNGGKSDIL